MKSSAAQSFQVMEEIEGAGRRFMERGPTFRDFVELFRRCISKARGALSRASSISESRAGQSSARHPNLARAVALKPEVENNSPVAYKF